MCPFSAIPVTFKQKLKNQEAVEEGCVTLHCELSKPGVPAEWRKDGQLLTEGGKYQMKQEGRVSEILIRDLTLKDVGEYSCSVDAVVTSADLKVRGVFYLQYDLVASKVSSVFIYKQPESYFSCVCQHFQ